MKKRNSIEEYFDLKSSLFEPKLCFLDDWIIDIGSDFVISNSNANKLNNFTYNNHFKPIKDNLTKDENIISSPHLTFSYNRTTGKRRAYFSTATIIYNFLQLLLLVDSKEVSNFIENVESFFLTEDEINRARDLIKTDIRRYRDVMENKSDSKYYDLAQQMYERYKKDMNAKLSFDAFCSYYYKSMSDIRINLKKLYNMFSKPINYDEFMECFDYDKFCLLCAYCFLDNNKMCFESSGIFDYSINYISDYLYAVEQMRSKYPSYNVKINRLNEVTGKYEKYDIDYLIKEVNKLLVLNPDYTSCNISEKDADRLVRMYGYEDVDFTTKEGYLILEEVLKKERDNKELSVDWEFIPNTQENKSRIERLDREVIAGITKDTGVDINVRNQYMLQCKNFLDNSPFCYKVYGEKYFRGYIGYIYSNGKVIFEKFYENEKTCRVSNGNATYVMEVISFLENSKLSKHELISKVSSGEISDVRRIFHRLNDFDTWSQNISQAISGNNYSDEIINYINNLISNNEISNKKQLVK